MSLLGSNLLLLPNMLAMVDMWDSSSRFQLSGRRKRLLDMGEEAATVGV